MTGPRRVWLGALLLALATAAAYAGVVDLGFIWDDDLRVHENPTLHGLEGLRLIWFDVTANKQYYPLVFTGFWLENRVWGMQPTGFHVVNAVLHFLGALLLWRLLWLLELPGAWLAAALFALHPVHVESVAWVSERKNVLSGLFYLAAAIVVLRGAGVTREPAAHTFGRTLLGLALFQCALFSKTVACTLPAALLLVLWWKRGRIARREVLELAPMFVLGIGFGLLTAWLEKSAVGATGVAWDHSGYERVLIAGRVVWFYLGKLAWPDPLIFSYPRWEIDAAQHWQALYPLAAGLALVGLWLARERIGRGPLVALLFFGGTLLPALGFFDVYPMRFSFVADHFQYLASVGPLALAAAVGTHASRRAGAPGRWIGLALAGVVLAGLGTLTHQRVPVYDGLESLWRDTVSQNPSSSLAHYNLGNLLRDRGERESAIHHYRQAVAFETTLTLAHNNLAGVLVQGGDTREAIVHYRRAVELDPDYALAHYNLATVLRDLGRLEAAIDHYAQALRADPDYAQAHYALGRSLAEAGRPDDAHPHFVEAGRLRREARTQP